MQLSSTHRSACQWQLDTIKAATMSRVGRRFNKRQFQAEGQSIHRRDAQRGSSVTTDQMHEDVTQTGLGVSYAENKSQPPQPCVTNPGQGPGPVQGGNLTASTMDLTS